MYANQPSLKHAQLRTFVNHRQIFLFPAFKRFRATNCAKRNTARAGRSMRGARPRTILGLILHLYCFAAQWTSNPVFTLSPVPRAVVGITKAPSPRRPRAAINTATCLGHFFSWNSEQPRTRRYGAALTAGINRG